jgi:bacillithiol biosynthesis deacetylase BshB1
MIDAMIFAPHPDDAELGMGATIALLVQQGMKAMVVDMSNGEPTPYGTPEIRAKERDAATAALGLKPEHRLLLDFPNRTFVHGIDGRHKLAGVIRTHKPRWIFAPYMPDAHPDHVAATRMIEDARFDSKLTRTDMPGEPHYPERVIYYFATHLRVHSAVSFCVDVSNVYERKVRSLEAYQSQFYVGRGAQAGAVVEVLRVRDRYFGTRIGSPYAEPFFLHEPLGLKGLKEIL